MISQRMKEFVNGSSAIRAMFEDGKKMAAIHGIDNIYDFSLGNPSVPPPIAVKQAILEIIENESPNFIHGYTNNAGYQDVREIVAHETNKEFKTNYTEKNIAMTCGAAGGLNIIFRVLLNPGDEVIVFAPYFGEYKSYVKNFDGDLVVVEADTKNFQINLDAFEQKINGRTKAVIINTPNNPTGVIYTEKTLKALSEILEKKQSQIGHPIYLISDEPYRYLAFDDTIVPFAAKYYNNTFVGYSFSKALSLPGERIGYIIANSEMDGFEEIMGALNTANRILGFVNAPSLFQRVIPYCINQKVDLSIYNKNREKLYEMLISLGFECQKPNGAFYMFPKALIEDDKAFCESAKEFRILIVPGSAFQCPGYFRLAYCVDYKTIEKSYDSFRLLAQKYRR